jgi:hypothetical protein
MTHSEGFFPFDSRFPWPFATPTKADWPQSDDPGEGLCLKYARRLQAPPAMPRRDIRKDRLPSCAILSFLSLDKLV